MHRRSFLFTIPAIAIAAGTSFAALADTHSQRDKLFAALKAAKTEQEGRAIEYAIWNWWVDQAPSIAVRDAIDHGMERRQAYDYEAAERAFDIAVKEAPGYAEGWNQRAFARFLREDNEGALSDLEKAIELEPNHFGAWSGMFHILFSMGRTEVAFSALARAVEIHPWLKERNMLPPDADAERPPIKGLEQDL